MKRKKRARHISPLMLLAPFLVDWWHNHPDGVEHMEAVVAVGCPRPG